LIRWPYKIVYSFIITASFLSTSVFAEGITAVTGHTPNFIPAQDMLGSAEKLAADKPSPKKGIIRLNTKGYYKNLAVASRSIVSNKPFFGDLQRFRIEPTINIGDNLQIYAAMDNEMITGDYLKAPDFDLVKQKNEKNLNWLPVQWTLADKNGVYYTTYLYRGYIKYDDPKCQIIVGKQKIDWGRGRFWSPTDLFNPNSPLDIEKDERVGVDAASLTASITDFIDLDLIYVPYGALKKSSFATRALARIDNYDVFFMCGQFTDTNVIGACVDGYLGGAGVRAESTYSWEHGGNKFFRIIVGADYVFRNKLRMGAEYFFNGDATEVNRDEFFSSYQYSRKVLSLEKNLIGATVGYDLTPLLKWDNYLIYDIDGRSIFINPELRYNLRPNLDITLGAQVFWGTDSSEFGNYTDLYYTELKYYF